MDVLYKGNTTVIKNMKYFNVFDTLDCGQGFRFSRIDDYMVGVVYGRVIKVYKNGEDVIIDNCDKDAFESFFYNYFDLDFDYDKLINDFSHDEYVARGVEYAYGIRILNQQPFETLISFIISANNNITRIKGIISRICAKYGNELEDGFYDFPTSNQLMAASLDDLKAIGLGYRADYIYKTVRQINDGFDLESLRDLTYKDAKKKLQELCGVGPKVADCILLYSLGFSQAFPIDVHTRRVVEQLYFKRVGVKNSEIDSFIEEHFGEYAGVVQLFLFHYARHNL